MDGYGKGNEMSLVDRITEEKEEESETVMVAERWESMGSELQLHGWRN